MRRIRLGFTALAVLLLAPVAVLLLGALASLEREREARHELVASRVFDEAERSLDEFLREEEARPPEQYRAGADSPLAAPPAREFVLGYFQIEGESAGNVESPWAEGRAALGEQMRAIVPALPLAASRLKRQDSSARGQSAAGAAADPSPLPGTTRTLQKLAITGPSKLDDRDGAERSLDEQRKDAAPSSYEVIERLNLSKLSKSGARQSSAGPPPSAPAPRLKEEQFRARDVRPQAPSAPEPAPQAAAGSMADAVAPKAELDAALEPPREEGVTGSARYPLDVLETPQRLVLYRSVRFGSGPLTLQGLLIDRPRLTSWLETHVLEASELRPFAALEFASGSQDGFALAFPTDRFVYEHRFDEPFAVLRARLTLALLPDEGGSRYVYALGALLAAASALGLWAVYRRVAAAVHFSERRSNFVAAVSHELKTPLTAIRMYAEMLRDGMAPDEPTRRSYLDTITAESERLTRLIQNVLEFSKLERREQHAALVHDSPAPALRDALRALDAHARSLGFELCAQIDEPLPAVSIDRDALQQVLFNLIDNALKYARDREPKRVEVRCSAAPGGASIRVRDHGPGIGREHEPHLFEAFYRGQDELTRRTRGTGIGLALVRELVQRMHGEVSARNHPEGGLEVHVRLRSPRS